MIYDKRLAFVNMGNIIDSNPKYNLLSKHLDIGVLNYLMEDDEIIDWLYDYLGIIEDTYIKNLRMSDFSFLILPICKAFEKYLFNILQEIGYLSYIPEVVPKHLSRYLFDKDDKLKNEFTEYFNHINIPKNSPIRKKLINHIISLGNMYHRYRNLYLHAEADKVKSVEDARNIGGAIIKEINDFTKLAAESKINTKISDKVTI